MNSGPRIFAQAFGFTLGVQRRLEQVDILDPRDLHRVLEAQQQAGTRALLDFHLQHVLAFIGDGARGHFITVACRDHGGQRGLARTVRPHDGVDFTLVDGQVEPLEDFLAFHRDVQIFDYEHDDTFG